MSVAQSMATRFAYMENRQDKLALIHALTTETTRHLEEAARSIPPTTDPVQRINDLTTALGGMAADLCYLSACVHELAQIMLNDQNKDTP